MVREVIDAAIVQQFKRYLKKIGKDFDKLTAEELKAESIKFLQEKYPGAKKPPHNLVEFMASPKLSRTVKSTELTFPNELNNCKAVSKKRKKRSLNCASGWHQNILGDCVKYIEGEAGYYDAYSKCNALQASLPNYKVDMVTVLYKDIEDRKLGTFPPLKVDSGQNKKFWYELSWDSGSSTFKYMDGTPIKQGGKYINYKTENEADGKECAWAAADENPFGTLRIGAIACDKTRLVICVQRNDRPPPITVDVTARTVTSSTSNNPVVALTAKQDSKLPTFPCQSTSRRKRNTQGEEEKKENTNVPSNIQKLNLLLDPEKKKEREEKVRKARSDFQDNFGGMNYTVAYDSLFEILWYSQLPCFDVRNVTSNALDELSIIKKCSWKGKEMPCPKIFKTLPTDRGMCCTFNMKKAEEIFRNLKYSELVQSMQDLDDSNRYHMKIMKNGINLKRNNHSKLLVMGDQLLKRNKKVQ